MLHSAYERRGQHDRHRARVRHMAAAVGVAAVVAVLVAARNTPEAHAAGRAMSDASPVSIFGFGSHRIKDELDATRGQLDLANAQLERLNAVVHFSGQYHIGADLAASVYDIAVAEGIEPELGFRLVKAESDFNEHATSSAGALNRGAGTLIPRQGSCRGAAGSSNRARRSSSADLTPPAPMGVKHEPGAELAFPQTSPPSPHRR